MRTTPKTLDSTKGVILPLSDSDSPRQVIQMSADEHISEKVFENLQQYSGTHIYYLGRGVDEIHRTRVYRIT